MLSDPAHLLQSRMQAQACGRAYTFIWRCLVARAFTYCPLSNPNGNIGLSRSLASSINDSEHPEYAPIMRRKRINVGHAANLETREDCHYEYIQRQIPWTCGRPQWMHWLLLLINVRWAGCTSRKSRSSCSGAWANTAANLPTLHPHNECLTSLLSYSNASSS